jgi:predicted DNA-binding transcriptional regulator YafY
MPAAESHETLVRQLQMLQLIPRSPAQITVSQLTNELSKLDFPVTKRTVQRDLNDIALIMPLECNKKSKPYGWKWAKDAKAHLPMMSLQEALTLHLVNKHLGQILPLTMLTGLSPMFKQAEQTINSLGSKNQVSHWLQSVVIESPTQPMLAPQVLPEVQQAVYQAVFEQKQLEVSYQSYSANALKEYVLHPVGIMQRGQISYLGALVNDYNDIRLFALHRFTQAIIKPLNARTLANPTQWKEYLASGAAGFNASKAPIQMTASVDNELATLLRETPLSEDQTMIPHDNGFLLTASVHNTWQLQWWILSQGARMVVREPSALRASIQEEIKKMHARY